MKRLVSTKKKTKDEIPPPETALPVETTSLASRAKTSRHRINRQLVPSSPSRDATTTTTTTTTDNNNNDTKPATSNRPSPRRIRQYMRNGSNKGSSDSGGDSGGDDGDDDGDERASEPPSAGQHESSVKANGDSTNAEASSNALWMALAEGNDSESDDDELFQFPKQGPIPWNEGQEPNIPMPSDPIRSTALESELVEVKMDRDILRLQLSEARAELDIARSTLRMNVLDLEDQLRNLKQSERRQSELEENALLEEEIDRLARLAREQEEKKAADGNRDTVDGDGVTVSSEGAVKSSTNSTGPFWGKVEELLLPQEEHSQKSRSTELEHVPKERKLREHELEKEIRKMKEQAQVESKKFEESQRQVRWFQKELKAMFPQEGDASSLSSSDENTVGENNSLKNQSDDNQDNAAHMEKIEESNTDGKGGEHKSGASTDGTFDGASGSSKDSWIDKTFLPSDNSMETSTDGSIQDSNKHVKLLHKQRLELEQRLQELLDEIGTLRLRQRTSEHEKQQGHTQVLQLQTDLQEQQEQHRIELVEVQRQLEKWKGHSDTLQTNLKQRHNLAEQLTARSQLERKERQELSRRVEELELEKNEWKNILEKSRVDSEHKNGYLKRAMESLEIKLQENSADSQNLNGNSSETLPLEEVNSRQSQAALSEPQISDHDVPRDEESSRGLLDRIRGLEAERESHTELERALREQLKNITEQEKVAKTEAAAAEDRVRVLQTFLDASFSASPKKERQCELEQEYISVHSQNHVEVEKNQGESPEVLSKSSNNPANVVNSDSPKSAKNVELNSDSIKAEDDDFNDTQQRTSELSAHLGQIDSLESLTRTLKLPDIDEQSISSDAVVHNLHLKLEDEMENLKKRKERRRARAVSSGPTSDQGIDKYRTLLDSTSGLLQMKPKAIDVGGDQIRIINEQDFDSERSEDFQLTQIEQSEADNEFRKKMEEENSRLGTALETANYEKAQLEIELGDALQKINDSTTRIQTLDSEIAEYRSSSELYKIEKSEFTKNIDIARDKTATLITSISEIEEEKKSVEATLSTFKESLDAKEKIIIQNNESHRIKLEEMKKALSESLGAREENHTNANQISDLEAKIMLMGAESKANIELLSSNLDSVLEERNILDLKFRDACKELDECKESESELREAAQEIIEKLESAQDDIEKLSQTKELESNELEKAILKKNQRISDLEEDLSCKGRRLEQASIQLSELENEIFERDKEIEKLDAKRLQFQENASNQLVELEKFLEKDGQEIEMLKEEKAKLQDLVQNHEHQIEKQLSRLTEASLQLSEMESEIFAKDDEIEEIELRMNAMQVLEAQRSEFLQDSEVEKKSLEHQLESSNKTIQNLTSQVESIKQEKESEKTEAQRLLIEDGKKAKEILSRQNQLDRQLQNVSKLTEQNDKWQLKLEKSNEEKQELLNGISDVKIELTSIRKELEDSNEKIQELNAINRRLQDDLLCATEEDEKHRVHISQMEDQKETLSQKLESAMDNLAELQKQSKEVRDIDENQSADIIHKLQANIESAQAVDEETEGLIKNLTEQVEFERRSSRTSDYQRSELQTENEILKSQIPALDETNSKKNDKD